MSFPIVLLALLALGVSVASAANSIEGVWSFNGGAVGSRPVRRRLRLGLGLITFSDTVLLPNATACVSQTSLKIKLHDPKYDPLTEVLVKINGKKFAVVKGVKRLKKGITLKKLPSGTYKISILATTVLKQRLSGSQTYKSCTAGSGKIGLKKAKNITTTADF